MLTVWCTTWQVLESRGTYIYCGYDEDNQEYELCMPEPQPEAQEGAEEGGGE